MADYDVVIVGGGHNGLIAAAYLARAGRRTLVLERRALVGGACVTEEIAGAPGYRVSTGAAQLANLRPEIVAALELARFGYALILPDPLSVFPFPDGRHLALWQDPARTRAEVARFSARDAAALGGFHQECRTFCRLIEPLLYAEATPSRAAIEAAFVAAGEGALGREFLRDSIRAVLARRFESEPVKAVLGFTASFGSNAGPSTPGTAYVMAHHLFGATTGVPGQAGYVRGGMGGLAEALAAAARRHGAELRTDADVSEILVADGAARGVALADGERIAADAVLSNADPRRTFLGLIGAGRLAPDFVRAVRAIEMQGVALKVNCALERLPRFAAVPEGVVPARVSLCPSLDYVEAAWAEAARGRPAPAPLMTVHMQSAVDPSLAPAGKHTLTCYAQYFPYRLDPALGGWEAQRGAAGRAVLDTVAAYAPDLHDCIRHIEVMTPLDLERRFAMTGGHQFHGDLMAGQLFDRRPVPGSDGARTPIRGLYLCGAGTHPGGCIWGAPGELAARAVLVDLSS